MKKLILGLTLLALVGCGVDGPPSPPPPKPEPHSGIRVSGEARMGVAVSKSLI